MIATTNWLKSAGCQGLEYLDIKESFSLEGDSSGYGCFAKKTFAVGDILFTVPQQCIFSLSNVIALPFSDALLRFADGIGKSELVSAEFLIWLEMCRHKANPTCHFHAYFASLPSEDPTVYNWSDDLQSCFEATNIAAMLHEQNKQRLQAQFDLFRTFWAAIYDNDNHLYDVLSSDASYQNLSSISMETFMWARGMYLSRRYPDTYAMPPSGPKQPPGKIGRESNFGNTGALVPLLDILNHRPGNCWLVFNATPTELQVVCNHPIAEVCAIHGISPLFIFQNHNYQCQT